MANLKEMSDSRTALLWFEPSRLSIKPGLNGRDFSDPDNIAHVRALADSIKENGFLQSKPLELYLDGDAINVTDGESRYRAVMLLRDEGVTIDRVPCVVEPRGTNDADRILNQNIHNSGKRLTPLEEGRNIKRAVALGKTVAEVAAKIGRSLTYVNQALDFQAAPAEVHAAVVAGDISTTLAAKIVRREGNEAGATVVREAVKAAKAEGKAKATEKHVEPLTKPVAAKKAKAADSGCGVDRSLENGPMGFQARVAVWVRECFAGKGQDRVTRAHRFFEEAAELYQTAGVTAEDAHKLVDYVFGRPIGEPVQEIGGVMITLAALCTALNEDMETSGEQELERVTENIDLIRAKQAAKKTPGPLPGAYPKLGESAESVAA